MKSFKEHIQEVTDLDKHSPYRGNSTLGGSKTRSWNAKKGDKVTLKPNDRDYPDATGIITKIVSTDKRYGRGGAVTYKIKVKNKTIERKSYELVGLDQKVQRTKMKPTKKYGAGGSHPK